MRRPRLLALLVLPLPLLAATLRVNNAPHTSPDHVTIQAAINAAADGDTILVEGSTTAYDGFTLQNKRLNLIGPGYGLAANLGTPANKLGATVQGGNGYSYVRTSSTSAGSADGTLIMGLDFSTELILEDCANVTVARCHFNGNSMGRLRLDDAPATTVSQCFFRGSSSSFIAFYGPNTSGVRIENCLMPEAPLSIPSPVGTLYLNNNLLYGLSLSGGTSLSADNNLFLSNFSLPSGAGTFRNNLFYNGIPAVVVGGGNLSYSSHSLVMSRINASNATFDGRYQITDEPGPAPNPALDAGTDGTHIGPFGGANPYILSGVPPLPTIDELSVPQFASPGGDLTIRIKVGERP